MQRETKEFVTPGANKVVIHTFITAAERRDIQSVFLKDTSEFDPQMIKDYGLKGASMRITENLSLEKVVVSLNGSTEKVVENLLNLSTAEFDFIKKEINDVTSDKKFDEEKKI